MDNGMNQTNDPAVAEAREKAAPAFKELSGKILDVLPTVEEALGRVSAQLDELKLESSAELFYDTGRALESIINSLPTAFFENDAVEKVNPHLDLLAENIESIVNEYENKNITAIKKFLSSEFLPNFKSFRGELETALQKAYPNS
jgi:hypothetical protein